jgi:hypothetical protein
MGGNSGDSRLELVNCSANPSRSGTRVSVQSLFDYIEGGDTRDEFVRQFPSVKRDQGITRSSSHETPCWPERVLLDESLPHDLILEPGRSSSRDSSGLGSGTGVKNGELLRRAAGLVDAFLTTDRKVEFEHDLAAVPFGVVVILAR